MFKLVVGCVVAVASVSSFAAESSDAVLAQRATNLLTETNHKYEFTMSPIKVVNAQVVKASRANTVTTSVPAINPVTGDKTTKSITFAKTVCAEMTFVNKNDKTVKMIAIYGVEGDTLHLLKNTSYSPSANTLRDPAYGCADWAKGK